MAENTKEKPFSLEVTRVSMTDEVHSARILYQEGLVEEAKKLLYKILIQSPGFTRAQELLSEIQGVEEKKLFPSIPNNKVKAQKAPPLTDDVVSRLIRDLDLKGDEPEVDGTKNYWSESRALLNPQEAYDLGVAYFLMGFYRDAIRELDVAIRMIRMNHTVLGELGLASSILKAESLLLMGEAFDAKLYVEPILVEPEVKHEEKAPLYYMMGRIEEALGEPGAAKGWYKKAHLIDPGFRDTESRLQVIK